MGQANRWLFTEGDILNAPSVKEGLLPKEELALRHKGVHFIRLLTKNCATFATASVYFHRFYMFHKFQEHKLELTALGALFLAGKVEDTPKKVKDLILGAKELGVLQEYSDKELENSIFGIERLLLHVLRFELIVEHPYGYIKEYTKQLGLKTEEKIRKEHMQNSWAFANDSFYTTLCLEWEPEIVAIAMIHGAEIKTKIKYPEISFKSDWYNDWVENLPKELLDKISQKLLTLIDEPRVDFSVSGNIKSQEEKNGSERY